MVELLERTRFSSQCARSRARDGLPKISRNNIGRIRNKWVLIDD
jgi:hypothetical protein